ncbi:glycosyltransferase [Reyranella sp. CPCC 100927]|uniref:glycosyltransferase n=1 Tax=Reyranella sp. CPCC 100927 TaxID=2599616 RepID=UPI0011B6BF54|nr:glycosyltransferase [Reyranella sp. CPCC 100927]TWT12960.1 glycosyltransferase [Reyranella sp. CPCC 100927]
MQSRDVLFVTQYYRPELIGSGPFSADLAEWLVGCGRQVTVLTGLPHYPASEVFPAYRDRRGMREECNGVTVERLGAWIPRRRSAVARIAGEAWFLMYGAFALATGRVARHGVVLSLCPSILSVALGAMARLRHGRTVAIVHDIQSGLASGLGMVGRGWLARVMRSCERVVLNRADLVVVLSQEMADELRRIGVTAPVEVVPIWVDTDQVRPLPARNDGRLTVLYSGNLGKKQGLGQVIDLASVLQARRPEIDIVLRGNGNQADDLRRQIAERDLTNTRLTALLPDGGLSEGLAEGDIHLVPQDPEAAAFAVPSKVFNIMAAGRPFVATAHPGSLLWRLRHRSGAFICVPPNDPEAFADAVQQLADDAALRHALGERGRQFVERNLAKRKVLGDFVTRLDVLCARA